MTQDELFQQILDKQNEIIQNQAFATEALIIIANITLGLIIGYLAMRGMTKPWK